MWTDQEDAPNVSSTLAADAGAAKQESAHCLHVATLPCASYADAARGGAHAAKVESAILQDESQSSTRWILKKPPANCESLSRQYISQADYN